MLFVLEECTYNLFMTSKAIVPMEVDAVILTRLHKSV